MNLLNLTLDGVTYRVRVVYDSLVRSFELREGPNAGDMLSDRHERDLLGTKYPYTMRVEPDPRYLDDYDALFQALSAPVDTHTVTLPYGSGAITYEAMVESGSDTYAGMLGGRQRWKGLTVTYRPVSLQREATV